MRRNLNTKQSTKRSTFVKAAGLAGAAALTLGAATAAMTPASATVLDTDHPKVTESHFDFGKNWAVGAPVNGGDLKWDLINGYTYPKVSGYLYLTDEECGRVKVSYYDDDGGDHTYLGERTTGTYCAPGNGKTQWWVSLSSFSSLYVDHVHVSVQRLNSSGSWTTMGTDYEDFD